jgi:hypothetical protein
MAHDSQIHDSEEPEYVQPTKPGVCPRCKNTGFAYVEEQERGGPFKGVVYSRSSPVRCSCQGGELR